MSGLAPTILGTFNTGLDGALVIIDDSTGQVVDLGGDLIDWKFTPISSEITIKPIGNGGFDKHKITRSGWTGTITVARENGSLDRLEAAQEADYHKPAGQSKTRTFTIYETMNNESDGSIDEFRFNVCTLILEDPGDRKKDAAIEMKMKMTAQSRDVIQ